MMKRSQKKHEGDVLGLGTADPNQPLPFKGRRDARHPRGIDVGSRPSGIGDVPQRGGASGADLGGEEGADVEPESPDVAEKPDRD